MSNENREVTFEIVKQIGVLSSAQTGWKKEVNLVAWNGGKPKFDIREWDPNHERMSRGITLSDKEMKRMMEAVREKSQDINETFSANRTDNDMER